jgi:hypothetical protein
VDDFLLEQLGDVSLDFDHVREPASQNNLLATPQQIRGSKNKRAFKQKPELLEDYQPH